MQLTNSYRLLGTAPLNYGERLAARIEKRHLLVALVLAAPIFTGISQAFAQQANQPGFDPRQPEKYFENQTEQESLSRPPVTLPAVGRPNTGGDTKPQFVLRGIDVSGAQAIPRDRMPQPISPISARRSRKPTSPRSPARSAISTAQTAFI